MREKKYGKIINISSTSAHGNAGQINYSASKAGVIGMTRTAAKELGPRKRQRQRHCSRHDLDGYNEEHAPDAIARLEAMLPFIVPMNRKGAPRDIANLALFLASDESSFITGQVIVATAGLSCNQPGLFCS